MGNRKSLTNRERFEILKRDGFSCHYCGRRAPNVELQIDHIEAVANGGTNDQSNLIAACFECNSGKSATSILDSAPDFGSMSYHQIADFVSKRITDDIIDEMLQVADFDTVVDGCLHAVFKAMWFHTASSGMLLANLRSAGLPRGPIGSSIAAVAIRSSRHAIESAIDSAGVVSDYLNYEPPYLG